MKKTLLMAALAASVVGGALGCGGRGTHGKQATVPKALAVSESPVKLEIEERKKEYREQFGREISFNYGCYYGPDCVTDEDVLAILEHAIKNNRPFQKDRQYIDEYHANIAKYELRFNRKIPVIQYAGDVCKRKSQMRLYRFFNKNVVDTVNCQSNNYQTYLLRGALRKDEPLPDNIFVTKLDIWLATYKIQTGKTTFPAWFQELSDEDKIRHLSSATIFFMSASPFLSREEEDSIRVVLDKTIVEKEKELGRKMTGLEKVKTEYEIQFRRQVPPCECTDEELLLYLKHLIKYNMFRVHQPMRYIEKEEVRYILEDWHDDLKILHDF